jgi:hypothetical protein
MLCVAIHTKAPLGLHAKNEQWLGAAFDDPIQVGGRKLVTLRDAGEYIAGLPKAEHDALQLSRFRSHFQRQRDAVHRLV